MNKESGLPEHQPLHIANGIFVQQGETLNSAFESIFAQDHDGQVMEVDFASDSAVREVNK